MVRKPLLLRFMLFISLITFTFVLSSCGLLGDINDVLYPTATATPASGVTTPPPQEPTISPAPPMGTLQPGPTFTAPAPTQTLAQPTSPSDPTSQPDLAGGYSMVFARGSSVYRGGLWGTEPIEVAIVAEMQSSDFCSGRLALTRASTVYVMDLMEGRLDEFRLATEAAVTFAQIHWSEAGDVLVHTAAIEDASASTTGHSVLLRTIDPTTGSVSGKALIRDVTGARVLWLGGTPLQVVVLVPGNEGVPDQVRSLDMSDGHEAWRTDVEGVDATISVDGQLLMTQILSTDGGAARLRTQNLQSLATQPVEWALPAGTHAAAFSWSPGGQQVAFLLREGDGHGSATEGRGLWVYDRSTQAASRVLDEDAISASLVGWTPDGDYVVGHHRGQERDSHYYAVRPDGGDRRILTLDAEAEILGWMPAAPGASITRIVMDTWAPQFAEAAGDERATAAIVARLLSAQVEAPEKELSATVTQHLRDAGWSMDYRGATILRVDQGTFVGYIPPFGVYLMYDGRAQWAASGNVVIDARREGDALGLIFGILDDRAVQPAFLLLGRSTDGDWAPLWSPQGQRDWVATNGEILFSGDGLRELSVAGSSFGLDYGEHRVFAECLDCPHRRLRATWVREGTGYRRVTSLPADAPMHQVYWEMTEPTPYAIVFEVLWRLRNGVPTDELLAGTEVRGQIKECGLLDRDLLLVAEEEMVNGVRLADVEGAQRYYALTKEGVLIHMQKAPTQGS